MHKVLYVSYDGLTDPLGQSQILPYLIHLAKNNYEIHILSFEKKTVFEKQKAIINEIVGKNNIRWHFKFFTTRPKYVSKFYDIFRFKRYAVSLHKVHQFSIVHCRSYVGGEIGLLLQEQFAVKFIFDMRGFWVDERIDSGQWNNKKTFFKLIIQRYRKIEKKLINQADHIISLTHKAKGHLVQQFSVDPNRIQVIPCCVDLELFSTKNLNMQKQTLIKQQLHYKEKDHFIVYTGSLGGLYLVEEIFIFFKEMLKLNANSRLLLLSHTSIDSIRTYLEKHKIDETFVSSKWADRKDMPYYLSLCKMAICFIKPSFSKIASSPTKLAEYFAMGLPVLVNAGIGDDDEIINKYRNGVILNNFDAGLFEHAASAMQVVPSPNENSIACANEYFSLKQGADKYLSVYNSLMQ